MSSPNLEIMTELLEAGVHYGHQTKRWNPKMRDFILEEKNSIYIIDLSITIEQLAKAASYLGEMVKGGGKILFVGTKKQAQEAVREAAEVTGQFFVNQRWLEAPLPISRPSGAALPACANSRSSKKLPPFLA